MVLKLNQSEFEIDRDSSKCISCQVCVRQCSNDVHEYDEDEGSVLSDNSKCIGCHRCETLCPTGSIKIKQRESEFKRNANWTPEHLKNIYKQAQTGGVILTGMGCDKPYPVYWDHILFNASQVTNPSIDPLREPMEIRTFIGRKPDKLKMSSFKEPGSKTATYKNNLSPQLKLSVPILFSAMSYGSISLNAVKSLAKAASEFGTFYNTGEGGLHKDLKAYTANTIVQVASGRFGVDIEYLNSGAAVEIKIGQGAKPGIGGHLPGEKVNYDVSNTRMIPEGSDAIAFIASALDLMLPATRRDTLCLIPSSLSLISIAARASSIGMPTLSLITCGAAPVPPLKPSIDIKSAPALTMPLAIGATL